MKYLLLILLLTSCTLGHAQFGTPRDLAFWGQSQRLSCANPPALPSIAGLIWHLKSTLNITNNSDTTPSDGDTIKWWRDDTRNQDFKQLGSATNQLTYRNTFGPNGFPFVMQNDTATPFHCLTNYNGVTYSQTNTAFFVVSNALPTTVGGYELLDSGPGERSLVQSAADGVNNVLQSYSGSLLSGSQTPSGWMVMTVTWEGANSVIRTNGATMVTGDAGTGKFKGFVLFADDKRGDISATGWQGCMAEGLFYNTNFTTDQMLSVERHLMWKYCIANPPP